MKRGYLLVMVGVAALALAACGGSPTSPSAAAGVTLHGVALGQASATGVRAMSGSSGSSAITVTVQENSSLTTTISGNGTFELAGLPAGTFTLVFSRNGVTLGTVTVTNVPSQAEVSVVVQVSGNGVALVKVEVNGTDTTDDNDARTCLIAGGVQGEAIVLEGSVGTVTATPTVFDMLVNGNRASKPVTVDATGAHYSCAGIKGPCDAKLITPGAKVHVSGTLNVCNLSEAHVNANEVKFQH